MKIVREGKEIELTWQEMFEASQEYKHGCLIADITEKASEMGLKLSYEQFERAGRIVQKSLDNNDGISEYFWMTIENALEEVTE